MMWEAKKSEELKIDKSRNVLVQQYSSHFTNFSKVLPCRDVKTKEMRFKYPLCEKSPLSSTVAQDLNAAHKGNQLFSFIKQIRPSIVSVLQVAILGCFLRGPNNGSISLQRVLFKSWLLL